VAHWNTHITQVHTNPFLLSLVCFTILENSLKNPNQWVYKSFKSVAISDWSICNRKLSSDAKFYLWNLRNKYSFLFEVNYLYDSSSLWLQHDKEKLLDSSKLQIEIIVGRNHPYGFERLKRKKITNSMLVLPIKNERSLHAHTDD